MALLTDSEYATIQSSWAKLDPSVGMAARDLFAIGCYIVLTSKREKETAAGSKACWSAMAALSLPNELEIKIHKLLNEKGNEHELALVFKPHSEIFPLFDPYPIIPKPMQGKIGFE